MGPAAGFLGCKGLNMPVACKRGKQEDASGPRKQGSTDKVQPPAAANQGDVGKEPKLPQNHECEHNFKKKTNILP